MSDPWSDTRLHDYLDGRMDDDERRAFERRLEDDAELRARVEAYRSLGDQLRDDPPALDEAFYASARRRFRGRLPRSSTRPATWELAGLAAAALLVFALLLPQLWEDERMTLPPAMEPAAPEPVELAESIDRAEAEQEADAPEERFAPAPPEEKKLKSVGTLADERQDVARNEPLVAYTPLPIRTIEVPVGAFAKVADPDKEAAGARAQPQAEKRARSAVAETDADDAVVETERRFRVGPRPELTDCADLRARRIDGRIEIGLVRAVEGRDGGGAIACIVLLPPGEEPISWLEGYLD